MTMLRKLQLAPVLLLLAACLAAPAAGAELAKLWEKLARETDPVDRAKTTVAIGDELLKQAAKQFKDGSDEEGERTLADYRQAMHAAYDALVKTGRDPRRKPKGFKHLEIHLRKSRRRLDDIARALPYNDRGPVEEAIKDMEALRLELFDALMKVNRGAAPSEPPRKQDL